MTGKQSSPFFLPFLTVLLASMSPAAGAGAEEVYASVHVARSSFQDHDISSTTELEYAGAWAGSGAIGVRLTEHFRVEAFASAGKNDLNKIKVPQPEPDPGDPAPVNALQNTGNASIGQLTVINPMLNVYVDSNFDIPVDVYLGGGVGAVILDYSGIPKTTLLNLNATLPMRRPATLPKDDSSFVWNVLLGVNVHATKRLDFDLGYRMLADTDIGSKKAQVEVHELRLGMTWRFFEF